MAADHPARFDPVHRVTHRFQCDPHAFAAALLGELSQRPPTEWLTWWQQADAAAARALAGELVSPPAISEPFVARAVSRHIAPGSCLFLGNSMPVRDMDMYAVPDGPAILTAGNRGASGIDGTLAAAAGFAAGAGRRGTVVLGDLAFLHDLTSLALLRSLAVPLTVVILNNNGGGIFSFLPVAEEKDIFERYWGTPHGLRFEAAASLFSIPYVCADTPDAFVTAFRRAQKEEAPTIIEVPTDRAENVLLHQTLLQRVTEAVDAVL
jgi:2-succinyl-5-enolpyruvyl-6-hydroxy-3-cyclohexene-1-carboxylate synthase